MFNPVPAAEAVGCARGTVDGGSGGGQAGGLRYGSRVERLPTEDIARLLEAAASVVRAEAGALSEELAAWHPAPGEWCVKECLGHLIEAEKRGFAGRIRFLLEQDPASRPALASWDQIAVAKARGDCHASLPTLVGELTELRRASVALVAGLRVDDLARGGDHPQVGHITVGDVASEWVHHDRNHVKQILTNIQQRMWPQMGNAQRFSLVP